MPDHDALRINARAARQHNYKDDFIVTEAQVCILNDIIAGAVQGGDGTVLDAGFNKLAVDGSQLLQAARSCLGIVPCAQHPQGAQHKRKRQLARRQAPDTGGPAPSLWYAAQRHHWAAPLLAWAGRYSLKI